MVFAAVEGSGQKANRCMKMVYDRFGFQSDGSNRQRCKRAAKSGSRFCGQHGKNLEVPDGR